MEKIDLNKLAELTPANLKKAYKDILVETLYAPFEDVIKKMIVVKPYNIDKQDIAVKLAVIDSFYSTGVVRYHRKDFFTLADIICGITDFDKRIAKGDLTVVEDIINKAPYQCISIASKYCTLHNRYAAKKDDFAMYDSVMEKLLPLYYKKCGYKGQSPAYYKRRNDYCGYVKSIEDFLDFMGIKCPDRKRKFDAFIWLQRGLLKQ